MRALLLALLLPLSASAMPTLDGGFPVYADSCSGTITTASFSTGATNRLVVVLASFNASGAGFINSISSSPSVSFTLHSTHNSGASASSLRAWYHYATSGLSSTTVSVSTAAGCGTVAVFSFENAGTALGAQNTAGGNGNISVSVTPTGTGSRLLAGGYARIGTANPTLGSNETMLHEYDNGTTNTMWFWQDDTATTSGVAQSMTSNQSNNQTGGMVVEVLDTGGGGGGSPTNDRGMMGHF